MLVSMLMAKLKELETDGKGSPSMGLNLWP